MRASDPVYAQLRPELVETVPRQLVDLGDGRMMPVEPYRISVHGSIGIDALIAGDLGELHAEICSIADQQLEQTMRAYFALIDEVTRQTGNVVDAHGDAAEGLLGMLEKMDIAFDDDGNPHLEMIASPETAERMRAQLEAFTPDQMHRLVAIINSKREQHRASRRRRRSRATSWTSELNRRCVARPFGKRLGTSCSKAGSVCRAGSSSVCALRAR